MGFLALFVVGVLGLATYVYRSAYADTLRTLSVTVYGGQGGSITINPGNITCTGTCTHQFATGSDIQITAQPAAGRTIVASTVHGDFSCSADMLSCSFPSASSSLSPYVTYTWGWSVSKVDVRYRGSGAGSVTSSSGGLSCTSNCISGSIANSQPVTLTATPAAGSTFDGWDFSGGEATECFAVVSYDRPKKGVVTAGAIAGNGMVNKNPVCTMSALSDLERYKEVGYVVIPIFSKIATASQPSAGSQQSGGTAVQPSGSSTGGQTGQAGDQGKSAVAQSTMPIILPSDSKLRLKKGITFDQEAESLDATSKNEVVGIANESGMPLATLKVDLSSKPDWSSAKITYDTNVESHKSFVHNIAGVAGIVDKSFTLYVPHKAGDTHVGVCPGAASLETVNISCDGLYFVAKGQTLTSKDTAAIPDGGKVVAGFATVGTSQFWAVSGLTGTGGFSATEELANQYGALPVAGHDEARAGMQSIMYYIAGLVAIALALIGLGVKMGWFALIISKVRR